MCNATIIAWKSPRQKKQPGDLLNQLPSPTLPIVLNFDRL